MKSAFHLPRAAAVPVLAVLACMLAGCGQKGPLYLPSKPAASTPVPPQSLPPVPVAVPEQPPLSR